MLFFVLLAVRVSVISMTMGCVGPVLKKIPAGGNSYRNCSSSPNDVVLVICRQRTGGIGEQFTTPHLRQPLQTHVPRWHMFCARFGGTIEVGRLKVLLLGSRRIVPLQLLRMPLRRNGSAIET